MKLLDYCLFPVKEPTKFFLEPECRGYEIEYFGGALYSVCAQYTWMQLLKTAFKTEVIAVVEESLRL